MKLKDLIEWYEHLSPERLDRVTELYHEAASFRDPFNDVVGHNAIEAIFRHMFETTEDPRFKVIDKQVDGNVAWLRWEFIFGLKGRVMLIEGSSRLAFGADGRVADHRDYWDATDLFIQLPLLGTMAGYLKKRFSVPPGKQAEIE